jgi:hypothetical protein
MGRAGPHCWGGKGVICRLTICHSPPCFFTTQVRRPRNTPGSVARNPPGSPEKRLPSVISGGSEPTNRSTRPPRNIRLCAAFDTLVQLDASARVERHDDVGDSDPEYRRALEELLEADANAASWLHRIDAVFAAAAPPGEPRANAVDDPLELVGRNNRPLTRHHQRPPWIGRAVRRVHKGVPCPRSRMLAAGDSCDGEVADGLVACRSPAALKQPHVQARVERSVRRGSGGAVCSLRRSDRQRDRVPAPPSRFQPSRRAAHASPVTVSPHGTGWAELAAALSIVSHYERITDSTMAVLHLRRRGRQDYHRLRSRRRPCDRGPNQHHNRHARR